MRTRVDCYTERAFASCGIGRKNNRRSLVSRECEPTADIYRVELFANIYIVSHDDSRGIASAKQRDLRLDLENAPSHHGGVALG